MKLLLIAAAFLQLALGASIVDVICPDSCTCRVQDERLETSCSSYEFIKKLIPKQISTIVSLNINNASLNNVDSKLKYLKNLQSLDLSHNAIAALPSQFPYLPKLQELNLSNNRIENVVFGQLPKNLQIVDLSNNSIRNFPEDWSNLKQLKTLHFHDNPISCDCNNLFIFEQLLKANVNVPENLTCHSPKEFHGHLLTSVNCPEIKDNLLNLMLGDEAGSGLEDSEVPDDNSAFDEDKEFISADDVTENAENELNEEGSGEEGSGDDIIIPIMPIPKACHFNCSTPPPIGQHDEKDASPMPNMVNEIQHFFKDVIQPDEETVATTTATPLPEVSEEPVVTKVDLHQVETFPTNDTVVGEMERASIEGSGNQSVYIIVGLLVAFVAFSTIYIINKRMNRKKRRTQRKRNKSNENGFGEEMKPLGKSAESAKPVEQVNNKVPNAEATPLLNGQNGKVNEENNVKAPAPAEEEKNEEEEVEMRRPDKQDSLTPQPARVTIKAGELPDSVPKTPLLVQRHLNSDGEIVTTAVN